jgi:hypothetical protein
MIHVGAGVSMREFERHLPTIVLACEAREATDPRLVPHEHRGDGAAFRWLASVDVSMHGFPQTSRPGAIDVRPDGGGGAVYEHLDELPVWPAARLRAPDLAENVNKLKATGRSELHLFLRIHDTAMPFSLYHPLAWGDYVPSASLEAPDGLTGLGSLRRGGTRSCGGGDQPAGRALTASTSASRRGPATAPDHPPFIRLPPSITLVHVSPRTRHDQHVRPQRSAQIRM